MTKAETKKEPVQQRELMERIEYRDGRVILRPHEAKAAPLPRGTVAAFTLRRAEG